MTDYIDRETVVKALDSLCDRVCPYTKIQRSAMCGACPLGDAFIVIEDDIPAADVRPVVRGKWIKKENWYYCSECDFEMIFTGTFDEDQKFCYNCGADMRGDGECME